MGARPRIDLDGIHLVDSIGNVVCLLRHRTTEGLVLQMPESADLKVSWGDVEEAALDLATGKIRVTFSDALVGRANWLGGEKSLSGRWMDRFTLALTRKD
jgi:hypothetical protein